jgi:YidC/Oxa1 family membrane protein insertase
MLQADLRRDICPEVQPPPPADPVACGPGGDAGFLFIPDLTDNATGTVLLALIVLYVGSQLLSTLLMSQTTDRTQRMIFLALPFLFVPFIISFPAGLLLYWITTNLWTIVQQAIIRKRLGPMRPPGAESGMGLGELLRGGASSTSSEKAPPKAAVGNGRGQRENVPKGKPSGPPPAPPRRKKKRSGRRR